MDYTEGCEYGVFSRRSYGRRRRCNIRVLHEGDVVKREEGALWDYIYGFNHKLLGDSERGCAHISPNVWVGNGVVDALDNRALIAPFSLKEISKNLEEMKADTAPGPMGSRPFSTNGFGL